MMTSYVPDERGDEGWRYLDRGAAGLADRYSGTGVRWNRIPEPVRQQVVDTALAHPEASPRELAWQITDTQGYFISESSVCRILKRCHLITSPAYIVMSARDRFQHPTRRVNQLWQTDFTCFRVVGCGWYYLSTVLDDYSRYIIAWKLFQTMAASDVEETLDLALEAPGVSQVQVRSVVAWIGAEMEFALSQAVASGDAFEHRPSECGHCVQNFLADLDLRDLPGEAAGFELGADDTLPTADLRFYPAALVVPCCQLPGHAAVAADLGNMAIPNGWIPRRLRSGHCVLWRRYNHIQGLPIPFPQQIPCRRPIIGAVSQKARDRGIELIQEPG